MVIPILLQALYANWNFSKTPLISSTSLTFHLTTYSPSLLSCRPFALLPLATVVSWAHSGFPPRIQSPPLLRVPLHFVLSSRELLRQELGSKGSLSGWEGLTLATSEKRVHARSSVAPSRVPVCVCECLCLLCEHPFVTNGEGGVESRSEPWLESLQAKWTPVVYRFLVLSGGSCNRGQTQNTPLSFSSLLSVSLVFFHPLRILSFFWLCCRFQFMLPFVSPSSAFTLNSLLQMCMLWIFFTEYLLVFADRVWITMYQYMDSGCIDMWTWVVTDFMFWV